MTLRISAFTRAKLRAAVLDFLLEHHLPARLRHSDTGPAARVAMFHTGRCGSTVLGQMLAAQGEIFWAGELFSDMQNRYPRLASAPGAVIRILRRSIAEPHSLRALVRRSEYPRHYRIYGLETKYLPDQDLRQDWINMVLPEYIALLETHGFDRYIVLHRHHYLRMLVSWAVARTTGTWHSRGPTAEPAPVVLPVTDMLWGKWRGSLLERLRYLDAQHAQLLELLKGRRALFLSYEEHIGADPGIAYRAVCAFLGLPARPVGATLMRTNPFPVSRSVRNWDEVVDALVGTEYAWMLTQELSPDRANAG